MKLRILALLVAFNALMFGAPRPSVEDLQMCYEKNKISQFEYHGHTAIALTGELAAVLEEDNKTLQKIDYIKRFKNSDYIIQSNIDAVSKATCSMAINTNAKGIVISSLTGRTVRMVSRFRCPVDIIGMTTSEKAWRKLNLSWGVTPVLSEEFNSVDVMFYHALNHAKTIFKLEKGDNVVLTGGQTSGVSGNTNTIRLESV